MLRPLVVLWLAAPAALPDHRADIVEWTNSRGSRPVWPEAVLAGDRYDEAVADEIESSLEEARTAAPEDRAAFDRLEQLLLAHPELPQAAWLMAERHAIEAQHAVGASDARGGGANAARRLEGKRAGTFGFPQMEGDRSDEGPRGLARVGARPHDRVFVDGVLVEPGTELGAGRHHVQLFRENRRVSAAWIELGALPELTLTDPTRPCSELDLLGTRLGQTAPEPLPGVMCREWAVARPNANGGTSLAHCRGSHCDPWETVRPPASAAATVTETDAASSKGAAAAVPAWLTWGAIGLGSVVATGLILWRTGAFDSPAPSTEFVFTGPAAASITF